VRLPTPLLALVVALAACGSEGGGVIQPPDEPATPAPLPPFEVCINEFLPSNASGPQDATGEWADWIELHNPGDEPVALAGWTLSDDPEEPDKHEFGEASSIEGRGFLVLWADGDVDEGPHHVGFALDQAGGSLVLRDAHGQSSTVHYGPLGADRAAARVTDCCEGEGCFEAVPDGTPGGSNTDPDGREQILLERGSNWRYRDPADDPGANWTSPAFADSGWVQAPAPLGTGDGHLETWIATGTVTTWFRGSFAVAGNEEFDVLALHLLRDAGAVVYLNGIEVVRSNLAAGPTSPSMLALRDVVGQEESVYFPFEISAAALLPGVNHLAVEVHRAGDVDLGFDLEIVGRKAWPTPD